MLEQSIFRTDEVPEDQRFERWWELVRRTHAPLDLVRSTTRDFRAWQRVLQLDQVTVWPTTFETMRFLRTPRLIRSSDPESMHISVPISGPLEVVRGETETVHPPGTLFVANTSRPFDAVGGRQSGSHYGIGLEIPRSLLPLPRGGLDRIAACTLPAHAGYGGLLAKAVTQIVDDTDTFDATDGRRLGALLVDMVSALVTTTLGGLDAYTPQEHRELLLLRIKTFIQDNLADPDLRPPAVAAAQSVSLSYLHRLFQEDGTTVSSWIREQRLNRARRDLVDRTRQATPIAAIATRWGFRDATEFSRAFRSRFGEPPRDVRAAALAAEPKGPSRLTLVPPTER